MQTSTPATSVLQTSWNNLSLNKMQMFSGENLVTNFNIGLSLVTTEFIGDAEGVPRAIVQTSQAHGYYVPMNDPSELFGEIVTRADGTTISLSELLTQTLDAAVPEMIAKAEAMRAMSPLAPLGAPLPPPLPLVIG